MRQDAVTLEVVKLVIQNQTYTFKSTFNILLQEVKDELEAFKSEISNLKVSLQFAQAQVDDDQKNAYSKDTEIALHSENLK